MAHESTYGVVLSFGKYAGETLGSVADKDPGYLEWVVYKSSLSSLWKKACRRAIGEQTVSDLVLPKVRTSAQSKKARYSSKKTDQRGIVLKNSRTAAIRFPFWEHALRQQFKSIIDGSEWKGDTKAWEFPAVHLPKVVELFGKDTLKMTEQATMRYLKEVKRRSDLDAIREEEDAAFNIPTKIEFFPFQKVGVQFVIRAGGRAMIADQPGLGKTAMGIGVGLVYKAKTLVVVPKTVTLQWRKEIFKFTGKGSTIWDTQHTDGHGNNQFHIINYDAVRKRADELRKMGFELLICDEATNLRNRNTLRARTLLGGIYKKKVKKKVKGRETTVTVQKKYPGIKTKYVLFLTGTPIWNRPIEAYHLLSFLDPDRFKNFWHFTRRYGGWKGAEPKNLDELHDRTKDLIIRRLRKTVQPELPGKQRNDLHIKLDPAEQKEYDNLLNDLLKNWRFNGKATIGTMPKIQGFLTEKKLGRVAEIIDEYLDNDRSILIFSIYLDPLKKLKKKYGDQAEYIHGSLSATKRHALKERLVEGKSKVGLISLKAGGMALDGLQHVMDTVLFLNQDWVPGIHEQAEDRADRIGQTEKVQVFYLLCEGTIDEDMRALLAEKQEIIDTVTDGSLVSMAHSRSTFKEFVKRLTAKHKADSIA